MKKWDDWAFAATCCAFIMAVLVVLGVAPEHWCGLPSCSGPEVFAGYQTLLVGVGAIAAAYYTIRATRDAARDQAQAMFDTTERQIAENRRLSQEEMERLRADTNAERQTRARSVARAICPALVEMEAKAQSVLTFIAHSREKQTPKVSRIAETEFQLSIPVPPTLARHSSELHLLGDNIGPAIEQIIAFCEADNRLIANPTKLTLTPASHEPHAKQTAGLCRRALTDIKAMFPDL